MKRIRYYVLATVLAGWAVLNAAAQECSIIYVTPNGATTGAPGTVGTRANPAEINFAVTSLLSPTVRRVYMAVGTYQLNQVFPLQDSLIIEGGFNPIDNWRKTSGGSTYIFRDTFNYQPNPNRLVAFEGINRTAFRLSELEVVTANATNPVGGGFGKEGVTTYAVYLSGCSNYTLNRCLLRSGNGGNGRQGNAGIAGVNGSVGSVGQSGNEDGSGNNAGGVGVNTWSGGIAAGGAGGAGGAQGNNGGGASFPGLVGQVGFGPMSTGGNGGLGGVSNSSGFIPPIQTCTNDGSQGYNGLDGFNGSNGQGRIESPAAYDGTLGVPAHTAGFFQPGTGTSGLQAMPGGGGGGGGGGGNQDFSSFFGTPGSGAGGGGGGEGGQGGLGGAGGGGGGGSFALYVHNNGANTLVKDCQLLEGIPGQGGPGGLGGFGGVGGLGGPGGARGFFGQPIACDVGWGGNGGNGGTGGTGGNGGPGSIGSALPFFQQGGTAPLVQTLGSTLEPVVTVEFSGCTNNNVKIYSSVGGSNTWFLGAGATIPISGGDTVLLQYTTTGYKSLTLINNGNQFVYSDFFEIRTSGAGLNPSIVSSADTVCTGVPASFTSSLVGNAYEWNFGGGAPNQMGPGLQTVNGVVFNTPGTYWVKLRTVSSCCGYSDPDSFLVHVNPLPVSAAQITVQGGGLATACANEPLSFEAALANTGINPLFQWLVNGTIAQAGTGLPVFTTSNLNDGDLVQLRVVYTNECVTGDTVLSNTITANILPLPVFPTPNCFQVLPFGNPPSPNTFQLVVDPTTTQAGYSYLWDFGNGLQGIGDSIFVAYSVPDTYEVSLLLQDGTGCQSNTSCTLPIVVNPSLATGFVASPFSGCAPLTVSFQNTSAGAITNQWTFGSTGQTSTQASPSYTFAQPGVYTVTLIGFGNGVPSSDTATFDITVFPTPVADFAAIPTEAGLDDTTTFNSTSVGADTWQWNLGDGTTATGPTVTHYYPAEGQYTVTLIVSNDFGCTDTITKTDYILRDNSIVATPEQLANGLGLNVYPNPFAEALSVELHLQMPSSVTITLTDLTGRMVGTLHDGHLPMGTTQLNWPVPAELPAGLYLLNVSYGNRQWQYKLIHAAR